MSCSCKPTSVQVERRAVIGSGTLQRALTGGAG
jgi:hypothetical protein